jgi:hypothetical protein
MSEAKQQQQIQAPRVDEDTHGMLGAGGGGSNDVTSGGGNATGTPDAETAMRVGDAAIRGNVEEDKKKIFPEASQQPGQNAR